MRTAGGPNAAPPDTARLSVVEALEIQADYCAHRDSTVAARILTVVADDVASGGPTAALLPDTVRFGDFVGLRVMATLHRLALSRAYPVLGIYFPTLGGTGPGDPVSRADFGRHVVSALVEHPAEVAYGLSRVPQTNETGRAAPLRSALARLGPERPVRLREIGASAGLNLRADRLPLEAGAWVGPLPAILDRIGCDLDPVDITTPEGRLWLSGFVWVDDVERFQRLATAMRIAAEVPATVVRQDAVDFVGALDLVEGTTTVVWHSAMWPYLPDVTRRRIRDGIARLGARATPAARLAHASWERLPDAPDFDGFFGLVLRQWDGTRDGRPELLRIGVSHGTASRAVAPSDEVLAADPLA